MLVSSGDNAIDATLVSGIPVVANIQCSFWSGNDLGWEEQRIVADEEFSGLFVGNSWGG